MTHVSDHNPVHLVMFDITFSNRVFRFRFGSIWLNEPLFFKETSDFWRSISLTHLIPKLQSVSTFMEKWRRNFFNKFWEKLKKQKEVLHNLKDKIDAASGGEVKRGLLQEELYLKQRAKLFWLKEDNENTIFLHASASARKKANHINFLEDDDGVRVESTEVMCNILKEYYLKVFGEFERRN